MIKYVKNVRFAIAKLAFWHEALLCGIGHQNGWKKSRPFWALTKLWFTWYGLGGYSCKSPYKHSTDTLRWYATFVERCHFTLCFHKRNEGSLILHGICSTFECCLKVRNPDSQHVFCLFIFRGCVFIVFSQSKHMCGEISMVFPIWIQDIVFVSTSVLMMRFFLW
jgi:hypothetical protein